MHDDTPAFTAADGRLDGWQLVQLRQLASDASRLAADVERHLGPVDLDSLRTGHGITISATACNEVVDGVMTLHDLADAMEQLAGTFRLRTTTVTVTAAEVEAEAAAALAAGSTDPAFATLTARLLTTQLGLVALAAAIESDPETLTSWNELTVGELIAAFRNSTPALLEQASQLADIDMSTRWAQLGDASIVRLAAAFRQLADV